MKKFLICSLVAAASMNATAAAPLWLRNTAISPDGSTIAFTFKGDIFTVPVSGGTAYQLTSNPSYDTAPFWSPDGKKIAFSSDRDGSVDVFVISAEGGTARRVTTHSLRETVLGWLNDSTILFSSPIMPDRVAIQGDFASQVYAVSDKGGRPTMFSTIPMYALSVNSQGTVLYQDIKGYENPWRKHEMSSSTGDIWMIDGGKYTKLTTFGGNDKNPVWLNDEAYAYTSETDGTLNVYVSKVGDAESHQLTSFTTHPVRSLSAANNGTMAFSWNGEIYTLTPGGDPQKINVAIVTDDYDRDHYQSVRTTGATTMSVSPDGKEVAFVLRGDIYVTSVKYPTTKRITNTVGQERGVSYSPDGRTLVYDSERNGKWSLYTATIKKAEEKSFAYCTEVVETLLYTCDYAAQFPDYSPDGKKVAFWEDRHTLRVIDVESKAVSTVLDGKYNYSYSDGDLNFRWSPDSKYLLVDYIGVGGWMNTDIAMVSVDGTEIIDLTESGYSDGNARWALNGEAITWESGRYGMKSHGSWGNQSDIMFMALTPEAYDKLFVTEEEAALAKEASEAAEDEDADKDNKDKKKKKDKEETKPAIVYDFANRAIRTVRLTPQSGYVGDYFLNNDATKLYYTTRDATGKTNLMQYDLREEETTVLVREISGGIVPDAKGENLFVISYKGMFKVNLAGGDREPIAFEAEYDRHPSMEREYIFDHMWAQVKDKFYDADIHGIDWQGYGEAYRRFLPYINNNNDFAILLSEILGELNASHTGGSYYQTTDYRTATLAAYYDPAYEGDGLRVVETIAGGPLSTAKAGIKVGDVITAIDGVAILAGADYYPLLADKADKRVKLTVRSADGAERNVEVKPISNGELSELLYHRWVRRNQAYVDSISGGRIAYVHVEGMDGPSFSTVYSELLGKYRNREAVIVDTRWNGGGWLHNDLALLLAGKEYVRFCPRGQYIGSEPFSQWYKPSVMLVNEANYSDAHGAPFVYQTLGIGDVVGAPIPGTMTAVWWESQIDPTIVFGIPQVTSIDMQGNILENHQLQPDVEVYNTPEDVISGVDRQITICVQHLLGALK